MTSTYQWRYRGFHPTTFAKYDGFLHRGDRFDRRCATVAALVRETAAVAWIAAPMLEQSLDGDRSAVGSSGFLCYEDHD
jgi:hypothetical protein